LQRSMALNHGRIEQERLAREIGGNVALDFDWSVRRNIFGGRDSVRVRLLGRP
jgi:hypothetical protein